MKFQINLTPSAEEDLRHFRVFEQRFILDAVLNYLGVDANISLLIRGRIVEV
jgi:hypothetical protein